MKDSKRIYFWDNLRFVLIALVVIGHFIEQYDQSTHFKSLFMFIYAFHMPVFIFISGLFHKNEQITSKIFTYITLGYLYKIIVFVTRAVLGQKPHFYLLKEDGIPWYMFVLAAFILITYILRDINPKMILIASVVLACFTGYDSSIGDVFVLSRIIVFYPFYALGVLINRDALLKVSRLSVCRISSAFILSVYGFLCFAFLRYVYPFRPLFTGRNPFNETLYQGGCVFRLVYYIFAIIIGFAVICIIPERKLSFISTFGKRSLQVYFWHRPIIYVLEYFHFSDFLCPTTIGKLIYLLCAVILTLILSLKCFEYPMCLITKYRDNKSACRH